jgi:magnesium transporter
MKPEALEETLAALRIALEADDLTRGMAIIEALHTADQADLVAELGSLDQVALLTRLDPSESADVLEEMDDEDAAALAELLPSAQLADILDEMEDDEAADILGDLSTRPRRPCARWTSRRMSCPC